MATVQFKALIDLVELDQRLNALNDRESKYRQELEQVAQSLELLHVQSEQLKRDAVDARKLVDELELKMKELQAREQEEKDRLLKVTSKKEHAAVKLELEQVQQEQLDLEVQLIAAWNKHEQVQKDQVVQLEEIAQKQKELAARQQEISSSIENVQQEYKQEAIHRADLEKEVPEQWLDKYVVMRERVQDPVVTLFQQNCGSCFYAIAPKDLALLRGGALIQCKDCYRLLYAAA